jgi:cyclic pyranopterin phosphate synthase
VTLDPSWSRPRAYPIVDGAIATWALEVHVTDHCNLRCAGCCALSPFSPKRFLHPSELGRDLGWAKAALRPSVFKLVGGEPLLSPHLVALAQLAKESGIAPSVSLTTNGLLLARAPDALFACLDAITVSIYPGAGIDEPGLWALRERAARFGVALNEKRQATFQAMTRPSPSDDDAATRAVFEGCWLRHRCHTLHDGVLYACNRPPNLDGFLGAGSEYASRDGISLTPRERLVEDVQAYLERSEPLASCAHCLGGTGAFIPLRQLTPGEVRARRPE